MKSIRARSAAFALALAALAQPQAALAQQCIEQRDVSDGVIYAMPLLVDTVRAKCGSNLSANGFLASKGDAFLEPFRARQDATWPAALRLLEQFGNAGSGGNTDDTFAMISSLPESALRPFIDALIQQMVGGEIKLEDCGKIERGIALLSPLPPENIGGLASFLFEVAKVQNPTICAYRPE
ncbi:hypothetical protein J4558_01490 [Leptolyngbya sp. 15MV]|nr:hypothetical protein J4558_01490 [Leptolyngbya sp. 15MV]